jgi:hypothetical protein
MRQISALALTLTLLAAACGGTEREAGPTGNGNTNTTTQARGFTSCGLATCQPGQYCYDELLADCRNGCLSNLNCTDDQTCDKGSVDEGVCQNVSSNNNNNNNNNNNTDQVARCKAACEAAQACGLFDVAGTVECNAACGVVGDAVAKALADCVGNQGCSSSLPGCYNLECGPGYPCDAGQECVGGTCL